MFDFDGLIADTETPLYIAWCEEFRAHGVELQVHEWLKCVGAGPDAWSVLDHLEEVVGRPVDRATVEDRGTQKHHIALSSLAVMPGVVSLLQEASATGVPCAVASSSKSDWVHGFLGKLGLLESFDTIVTRDMVALPKPAPDLFSEACRRLDVEPGFAVAFEDSVNGVTSAKSAGLYCVAVPNEVTKSADLDHSDLIVGSLEELSLARLSELLAT